MMTKIIVKDTESFKAKVKEMYGDEYSVLGEYKGTTEKLLMRHNKCGTEYECTPTNFIKGRKCRTCNGTSRMNTESFKAKVKEMYGDEYTVLGEYVNNKTHIKMRHNTCGNEYMVKPNYFINNGTRCPYCYGNIRKGILDFNNALIKLKLDKEYKVIEESPEGNKKFTILHNVCGKKFDMTYNAFVNSGCRCTICNTNYRKKTQEEYENEVYEKFGDEYTVLGKYVNNNTFIKVRHNTCGTEFEVQPYDFITDRGKRCPLCNGFKGSSRGEKEVVEFVRSILPEGTKIYENRKVLNGLELDILIPSKAFAIEYDGIYWHSIGVGNINDKNYHINKTKMCKEEGITLIHIFDREWEDKQDIVKSRISNLLNQTKETIFARNCYVKEIDNGTKNSFLEENHLQGKDISSISLGLYTSDKYYEEEILVSIMTFSKPRRALGQNANTSYDYELSRFANMLDINIVGGFSKLFKFFERNYSWNKVITYADLRWSTGNLYETNGFHFKHKSKPNYWYHKKGGKLYHRYNFRKSSLKKKFPEIYDDIKTEFQIMDEAGYQRIYDCGNAVYEYTKNNKENVQYKNDIKVNKNPTTRKISKKIEEKLKDVTPNNIIIKDKTALKNNKDSKTPLKTGRKAMTHKEFCERVKKETEGEYEVIDTYIDSKTDITFLHNVCGTKFMQKPNFFLNRDYRCPSCKPRAKGSYHKLTTEKIIDRVNELVGDEYIIIGDYEPEKRHIMMRHNKCGYEWDCNINTFMNKGRRCPKCARRKVADSRIKEARERFNKLVEDNEEYELLGEYVNNKTPVKMKHIKCGHQWNISPINFISGNRCPKCNK